MLCNIYGIMRKIKCNIILWAEITIQNVDCSVVECFSFDMQCKKICFSCGLIATD